MSALISSLDSFESLLRDGNVISEELENLFSCQQVAEDLYIPEVAETMDYKSLQLCMRRSECLSVLKVPMVPPNILFIEEAAQVKEWELTIPLQLQGVKHAILVGVEYQLPAIVKMKVKIVDDYQGGEEDNVLWILVSSSFHKHVNALAEAFEKIDNTYSDCELWG
ncbi:unnamed protein product [Malus baccata var. baccata]